MAVNTLSYSELRAVLSHFRELNGNEGQLTALWLQTVSESTIVTPVNPDGSCRSLGMKGTYLGVLISDIFEEVKKRDYQWLRALIRLIILAEDLLLIVVDSRCSSSGNFPEAISKDDLPSERGDFTSSLLLMLTEENDCFIQKANLFPPPDWTSGRNFIREIWDLYHSMVHTAVSWWINVITSFFRDRPGYPFERAESAHRYLNRCLDGYLCPAVDAYVI